MDDMCILYAHVWCYPRLYVYIDFIYIHHYNMILSQILYFSVKPHARVCMAPSLSLSVPLLLSFYLIALNFTLSLHYLLY